MSETSTCGSEEKASIVMSRRSDGSGLPGVSSLCGGMRSGMTSVTSGSIAARTARSAAVWPRCGGLKLPP